MKPRDTYGSSYLKAQRCFCVLAASKMLKALLSAPHNGIPLFVFKTFPLTGNKLFLLCNALSTLWNHRGPPSGLKAAVDGGRELLDFSFLLLLSLFLLPATFGMCLRLLRKLFCTCLGWNYSSFPGQRSQTLTWAECVTFSLCQRSASGVLQGEVYEEIELITLS